MARSSLFALLLVGLCLTGQALGQQQQQRRRSQSSQELEREFPGQQQQPQPFRPNHQYTFTYNGQICTGLQQDSATSGGDSSQQKSATRIQAQAQIHFHSERHATLSLQNIRLGHLNQRIAEPQQVQPMGMFEQKQLDNDKRRELQLPCAFTYEDGVVARITFHPDDITWSKNIKRSVLNLLQLNLKLNNAQGLRVEQTGGQVVSAEQGQQGQQGQQQLGGQQFNQVFTIPEVTIEGACATTYTINKGNRQGGQSDSEESTSSNEQQQQQNDWAPQSVSCPNCFNVTKSVNFKQCSKIADVAYGYQTQQQQPQCAQCQQAWAQQQKNQQSGPQSSQQQQPSPCDQQCDPKEVKENKLERSTVQRFVLAGKPEEKYAIKRSELVSQYVYKNLRAESGQYGATMQAVVACELVFRGSKQQDAQSDNQQVKQLQNTKPSVERDESILFSNDWDTEEKRFYMYGEEEFSHTSPFVKVTNKVEQATAIIRKLIQAASNKASGIEVEEVVQIQRLAELLRMCTTQELKEIQDALLGSQQQQQQGGRNEADQQKAQHILADALAIAGSRNCINALSEQILSHKVSPQKAAQSLKALNGLPAPSDSQATIVLRLCQSELVNRNPTLKQSCWLTFGAMVGELCLQKTQKNAQQGAAFGAQSGFNKDEICPTHKKQIYKQTLIERYEKAKQQGSTYEKVLALKCLGNAGIDIAVPQLEQIIKNKREQRVPRIQAIDALRRLRTQMPRKIQRILLPIFLNTREHPTVRMACFGMIMHTQPEQPIVDQLAYSLTKERSQQVLSFAYNTMKTLSKSKIPCQQSLAKNLKSALKLVNIDEATLRGSSQKYQVPIYSQEEKEGLFLTLTSVVSSRSALPSHLAISLDTLINGQFEVNNVKVGMTQQGVEQWYEKIMQQLLQQAQQYVQQQPTRGQRSQQRGQGSEQLRKIFNALSIKGRQQGFTSTEQDQQDQDQQQQGGARSDQQQKPFGMINMRVGDVDQCVLSIDQQSLPSFARNILNGQKPNLRNLMEALEQPQHFRIFTAQNLNEKTAKIATTMGIPLRMLSSFPILASVEGQVKVGESSSDRLESTSGGSKLQLSIHPSIAVAHIQRMETFLPAIITGVESVRCLEVNLPIQAEAQASQQKGMEVSIKLPQSQKTRIVGLHTLPATYHREFDNKQKTQKTARVKNIHNDELEQLQREVQTTVGQHALGLPIRVQGHYHTVSAPISYKQIVQLLMGTENQLHISYEPTPDSPRSIRLGAIGSAFQKVDSASFESHRPQLKEFYSNSAKFEHAYPQDYEDMQLEDHTQRRDKLNNFLNGYQPDVMYKHTLKLSAECVGGSKRVKASMEVEGACDSKLKYCKCFLSCDRSPMSAGEQQNWQLKAKVQVLTPDVVSSAQQLGQVQKKHQNFVCQAETQWGPAGEKKQYLNVRIQGEQAAKPQWQQSHIMRQQRQGSSEQQSLKSYKKKTAFLNKFDVVADYKLEPQMQSAFSRIFETAKAEYFWATETELNNNQISERSQSEGQVYGTVVIDPITQKHCNISVKTQTQAVRIQQIQLPTQIRPFPLVRQQSEKSTHSVGQMFQRLGVSNTGRAECKVDGQKVFTFDNVQYRAPISKCYTVLAKDCSSNQPQFSVLMKSLQQNGGNQQQSGSQQPKKLKVITPDQVIECKPKNPDSQQPMANQPLKCTVNGREIGQQRQQQGSNSFEMQGDANVEYDNEEKTSCTINVPAGVQVKFNGAKAWIKISNAYKNNQCGLCGHYDDEAGDEWRLPNNERASSLDSFHRSYAVQEEGECSTQEHQDFYAQNKNNFAVDDSSEEFRGQKNQQWGNSNGQHRNQPYQSAYSDESYDDQDQDQESQEESSWWGQQQKSRRQQRKGQKFGNGNNNGNGQSNSQEQQTQDPVKKTKVVEYSQMICFSTSPVKQCPEGTWPSEQDQTNNNGNDDYSSGEQQQGGRQSSGPNTKKVQFACLPRSSPDARRLQRQARQGGVVEEVSGLQPSFVESVKQPTSCVRY